MKTGYVLALLTAAIARLAWGLVQPGPHALDAHHLRIADE